MSVSVYKWPTGVLLGSSITNLLQGIQSIKNFPHWRKYHTPLCIKQPEISVGCSCKTCTVKNTPVYICIFICNIHQLKLHRGTWKKHPYTFTCSRAPKVATVPFLTIFTILLANELHKGGSSHVTFNSLWLVEKEYFMFVKIVFIEHPLKWIHWFWTKLKDKKHTFDLWS